MSCQIKKKKKNLTLFSNKNDLTLCKILSYMPSLLLNLPYMWFSFITYNLILTHGYFLLVAYNHISIALSHLDLNLSLSLSLIVVIAIKIGWKKSNRDNWIQIHKFKFFGLRDCILTFELVSLQCVIF